MACVYFEVVAHMRGGEVLARNVGDPITELVVTCRDNYSLLAVEGVADVKYRATSIAMVRKSKGIGALAQE